MNWGH